MLVLLQSEGLGNGGINFDAKVRRNSTNLEDMFIAHISGMDIFAKALLIAADFLENSSYRSMRKLRYASFDADQGKAFEEGKITLEALVQYASQNGEPAQKSGQQEVYERLLSLYM